MDLFAEEKEEGKAFWAFLIKNTKWLLLIGMASGILAGIVTLQIPSRYASTAVFFPPSYQDSATIILNSRLGIELHTNRLVELLRSSRVKDRLAQEFDLYDYYKLEKEDYEGLYRALGNDLRISRTDMLSVQVIATTQDAQLSANLANAVVNMTDEIWQDVFQEVGPVGKIYLVEKARVSSRPVSPSYWRNIGITAVSSGLIFLVLVGFWEKIRKKDLR